MCYLTKAVYCNLVAYTPLKDNNGEHFQFVNRLITFYFKTAIVRRYNS